MQSSFAHQSVWVKLLHPLTDIRAACTWSMGQILTILTDIKAALHISQYGSEFLHISPWYQSSSAHQSNGSEFLHIRPWYQSSLDISGLWMKTLHPYWLICRAALISVGCGSEFLHIRLICKAALISWSTYVRILTHTDWYAKQLWYHGLWVKFLHINWYQSSLHMVYGWNSYPYWLICKAALISWLVWVRILTY